MRFLGWRIRQIPIALGLLNRVRSVKSWWLPPRLHGQGTAINFAVLRTFARLLSVVGLEWFAGRVLVFDALDKNSVEKSMEEVGL